MNARLSRSLILAMYFLYILTLPPAIYSQNGTTYIRHVARPIPGQYIVVLKDEAATGGQSVIARDASSLASEMASTYR